MEGFWHNPICNILLLNLANLCNVRFVLWKLIFKVVQAGLKLRQFSNLKIWTQNRTFQDQATEVILTLGEAFEVAYQMALREQSNRTRVTQSLAKTPTHDPMTTTNKEKPNVNHGRSHSITEIKLNGHQLKIAPLPASLSNEDFQAGTKSSDGSRSPRTPLLKAPIASTEELWNFRK